MSEPQSSTSPGPYAQAAPLYWAASWRGILPLPARKKGPVPDGYTGNQGAWPSYADVHAWAEDRGAGNIALRLPPDVLGVDVDAYDSKPGGLVLAALEEKLGALPATWRSTSRDDGTSGIRLYRIPVGLRWPGILGPGIEVLRMGHRYAVAWPSIHPDTGSTYRWITPDGATALGVVPNVDDLPDLPDAWVEHFTKGELAVDQARANISGSAVSDWLKERGQGDMCRHMTSALKAGETSLTAGGARHEAALALTNRIVWIAGEGHRGGIHALAFAKYAFLKAAAGARDGLEGEWDRMVEGAVRMAAAAFPDPSPDPCDDPFHGLIAREDNPWKTTSSSTISGETAPTPRMNGEPPSGAGTPSAPSVEPAGQGSSSSDPLARTRTTWWPRNIQAAINGEDVDDPPAFLARNDGHAMFYPGRVNGIIGPSESGKTWVALEAVRQAVEAKRRVTILDFEDSDRGVVGRLLALGVTVGDLGDFVAYINPDEPFSQLAPSGLDLLEHLDSWQPALIVLDGFNAAMTLQGLDLMSNRDATLFSQLVLKPLTRNDACVVYIDHVPKDVENAAAGGIGAQAKRAMTTGCCLKVEVVQPFGKGQDGKLRAFVDKDRQGLVRGISAPTKGRHWACEVGIKNVAGGAISVTLSKPEGLDVETGKLNWRPTIYMQRVSDWLEQNPGAGTNKIKADVAGDDKHIGPALAKLIEEGWVAYDVDGQRHLHRVVEPFNELLPPPVGRTGGTGGDRGWTGGGTTGGGGGAGVHRTPGTPPPVTQPPRVDDKEATSKKPRGRVVERVIGGERFLLNLDTGEMEPA